MNGDRSIAFVAFTTAILLHLAVFVLTSYMPITKLERPTPPSRTRYIVQFQQPAPTTPPTPVPITPTLEPQTTPDLPVPPSVEPVPQQPVPEPVRITQQQPQPTAVEIQRPEPLDPPLELQPRQPEQSQRPVRISPRREVANVPLPQPIDSVPIKRSKPVAVRQPVAVKVQPNPLPPFPKALKKPSLRVTLPILYELTER